MNTIFIWDEKLNDVIYKFNEVFVHNYRNDSLITADSNQILIHDNILYYSNTLNIIDVKIILDYNNINLKYY